MTNISRRIKIERIKLKDTILENQSLVSDLQRLHLALSVSKSNIFESRSLLKVLDHAYSKLRMRNSKLYAF